MLNVGLSTKIKGIYTELLHRSFVLKLTVDLEFRAVYTAGTVFLDYNS